MEQAFAHVAEQKSTAIKGNITNAEEIQSPGDKHDPAASQGPALEESKE